MLLHGNVGEDQPQRQGAVSTAAQHGEKPQHLATAGREKRPLGEEHDQNQGEMQHDVNS